jgi:hypothetical protein
LEVDRHFSGGRGGELDFFSFTQDQVLSMKTPLMRRFCFWGVCDVIRTRFLLIGLDAYSAAALPDKWIICSLPYRYISRATPATLNHLARGDPTRAPDCLFCSPVKDPRAFLDVWIGCLGMGVARSGNVLRIVGTGGGISGQRGNRKGTHQDSTWVSFGLGLRFQLRTSGLPRFGEASGSAVREGQPAHALPRILGTQSNAVKVFHLLHMEKKGAFP